MLVAEELNRDNFPTLWWGGGLGEGTYDAVLTEERVVVFGPAWGYPLAWGDKYEDQWEMPLEEFLKRYTPRETW